MKKVIHPGKILKKDYIDKYKLTIYHVAKNSFLSQTRLSEIVNGKRSITVETALKLGKFFGIKPETFLELQMEFDIENANKEYQKDLVLIKKLEK